MISAYNSIWLTNLGIVKDAKSWLKSKLITADQATEITKAYPCEFYHPNIVIRITLFIATWIGIGGVSGLFFLMLQDASESSVSVLCVIYGSSSILILEKQFIQSANHYKSGVTEAILYQALGFIIGGITSLFDFNMHILLIASVVFLTAAAIRYHDLVLTAAAVGSFFYLIFYELYELGGLFKTLMPFVMMSIAAPVYFYSRILKQKWFLWENCILVVECAALILFYLSGNYLVVRELSKELMNLNLAVDEEIPFALFFYLFTIVTPFVYLYWGVRKRDIVSIRLSVLALVFSILTYKYYFFPELNALRLTGFGAVVIGITLVLLKYLKNPKAGYTRELVIEQPLGNAQAEAFIISQTLGGNQQPESAHQNQGGGGSFGGGGASGDF